MLDQLRATYRQACRREEFRPSWLGVFFNGAWLFRRGLHNAIHRHAPSIRGTVVDFGCGQKPYRSLINTERYIGLDVPLSGHPNAEKTADIFFDGTHIPLSDASADWVIASEVFEHVFDLPTALREIHRILKPGGTLLVTCPFCWNEHEVPYDFARYTRFGLAHLLTAADFRVVVQEKEVHFLPALAQMALVYCNAHLRPARGGFAAILSVFYNTGWNCVGLLLGKLLPARWDFYLANVALAQKS